MIQTSIKLLWLAAALSVPALADEPAPQQPAQATPAPQDAGVQPSADASSTSSPAPADVPAPASPPPAAAIAAPQATELPAAAPDGSAVEQIGAQAIDVTALISPGALGDAGRPLVNVGGFAVVTLQGNSTTPTPRIDVGQLTVHATVDLGANFGAFTEVTINSVPGWEVRVERLLLFWEQSDNLKLTVGRYHLPVTWWNATFHHGLWLQTTLRRPTIVGFNDAFVPNHAVGLMADGLVPGLSSLGLRYHASVTGGGNDHFYTHGDHGSEKSRLAYTGSLYVEPPTAPNLRVGAVAYYDPQRIRNEVVTPETTLAAHVVWTGEEPELLAEVVQVNHEQDNRGVRSFRSSWGGYVQAAWRLPVMQGRWKPYARFDWLQLDKSDTALSTSKSQRLGTLGVRFDPTMWLALKVDGAYRQLDEMPGEVLGAFQVEAAW